MNPTKSYEEQLKDLGFKPAGLCNCSGGRTHKFKDATYIVHVNKGARVFRIKKGKETIITFTPLNKLISTLNTLLNVAV